MVPEKIDKGHDVDLVRSVTITTAILCEDVKTLQELVNHENCNRTIDQFCLKESLGRAAKRLSPVFNQELYIVDADLKDLKISYLYVAILS